MKMMNAKKMRTVPKTTTTRDQSMPNLYFSTLNVRKIPASIYPITAWHKELVVIAQIIHLNKIVKVAARQRRNNGCFKDPTPPMIFVNGCSTQKRTVVLLSSLITSIVTMEFSFRNISIATASSPV